MPTSLSELFSTDNNIGLIFLLILGAFFVAKALKKLFFVLLHRARNRG